MNPVEEPLCRVCGEPISAGRNRDGLLTDDGAVIHGVCPTVKKEVG